MNERRRVAVLGQPLDALTWEEALNRIAAWAAQRESRYVCITNAHSVVTGSQDPAFGQLLRDADMVTPDGAPVAWMMRRLGVLDQQRINGPDLMWRYCEEASARAEAIFLYGGTEATLAALKQRLARRGQGCGLPARSHRHSAHRHQKSWRLTSRSSIHQAPKRSGFLSGARSRSTGWQHSVDESMP